MQPRRGLLLDRVARRIAGSRRHRQQRPRRANRSGAHDRRAARCPLPATRRHGDDRRRGLRLTPSTGCAGRRPTAICRGAIFRIASIIFPAGAATAPPGCRRGCAGTATRFTIADERTAKLLRRNLGSILTEDACAIRLACSNRGGRNAHAIARRSRSGLCRALAAGRSLRPGWALPGVEETRSAQP